MRDSKNDHKTKRKVGKKPFNRDCALALMLSVLVIPPDFAGILHPTLCFSAFFSIQYSVIAQPR
jgi:hypothetical protein